jgi:hypothetical protein
MQYTQDATARGDARRSDARRVACNIADGNALGPAYVEITGPLRDACLYIWLGSTTELRLYPLLSTTRGCDVVAQRPIGDKPESRTLRAADRERLHLLTARA